MDSTIKIGKQEFNYDLDKGIDISIPLKQGPDQVKCFYAPNFSISPVETKDFIGSIESGGLINFKNISLNPHGNGTHTECLSHIWPGELTINQCLKKFFHLAQLITVQPYLDKNGDQYIRCEDLSKVFKRAKNVSALIVRSLPNSKDKLRKDYSGTNPIYFTPDAMELIVSEGIRHLLTDLPSVDKEVDGGALSAHKIFWGLPSQPRRESTITELIYVDNQVEDGYYL